MQLQSLSAGPSTAEDIKKKTQLHRGLLAEKKSAFTAEESQKYPFPTPQQRGPLKPLQARQTDGNRQNDQHRQGQASYWRRNNPFFKNNNPLRSNNNNSVRDNSNPFRNNDPFRNHQPTQPQNPFRQNDPFGNNDLFRNRNFKRNPNPFQNGHGTNPFKQNSNQIRETGRAPADHSKSGRRGAQTNVPTGP